LTIHSKTRRKRVTKL